MLVFACILYAAAISFIANSYAIVLQEPQSLFFLVPIFLFINVLAGCSILKTKRKCADIFIYRFSLEVQLF